jgi:glycosyltransferase involved in cell wall biosynthesis
MLPTVSVVIPTFNRSKLLLNALESILAQTYADYEIIIVDDGSTDDTFERLKPFLTRVRYLYQPHRGISAALNTGIQAAVGKWISVLASDDTWLPTKLERQFEALNTLGPEFGACFTDCAYVGNPDMRLTAFQQAQFDNQTAFDVLHDPMKWVMTKYPVIYVQSLIVLRSLLGQINGFDESMTVAEDTDLIFRLALKTKFCLVSTPLVEIDRTPHRSVGLIEAYSERKDQSYACIRHMYGKWLEFPEIDLRTREVIRLHLRATHYSWAAARLHKLRFAAVLENANELRALGDSYTTVLRTLLLRGVKKLNGVSPSTAGETQLQ